MDLLVGPFGPQCRELQLGQYFQVLFFNLAASFEPMLFLLEYYWLNKKYQLNCTGLPMRNLYYAIDVFRSDDFIF